MDFYLDGTKLSISGSSTAAISSGGSITVISSGTWTATSGSHSVYAVVDPSNVVAESNESNNQSSTYSVTVSGGSTMSFLKANGQNICNNSGAGSVVALHGTNLGSDMLMEAWMSPLNATDDYSMRSTLINRFGTSTTDSVINSYQTAWITSSDLDNIKNMGLNFVRVPIYWENLMNRDGSWKANAFTQLDWLVNQCAQRGIYVLIDMHGVPGGDDDWQSGGRVDNELWTNTTDQNMVVSLWQGIAAHYKGNPTVAGYDLLNEPVSTNSNLSISAFYNTLYQTVRAIDPDHMIFLEAFYDFSYIASPSTYGWTNVVYETHPYDMSGSDPTNWTAQYNTINSALQTLENYKTSWNVPVYAGEFCWYSFNDLWQTWLSALDANGISWSNWSYKNSADDGNWAFYDNCTEPVPDLNNDSSSTIASKWSQFTTNNFTPNTALINIFKQYSTTPTQQVNIKAAANGDYVSADNYGNNPLVANRTTASAWEAYIIYNNPDGTVSLQSMANNKFVSADLNQSDKLIAETNAPNAWEEFKEVSMGGGNIAFQSVANNDYVTCDLNNGAVLYAKATTPSGWETFTITPVAGTGQPDLSVTNITYSPTSPAAGNTVSFTATILNSGTANLAAGTGFGVDFYLDGTKLSISGSSTSAISAGNSITVTSNGTWTATSGSHNVYAIVDPSNVVAESNENNNQSSNYNVTVSSGSGNSVPGKIEAENYTDMYGIQTETCSEGTLDVGYFDSGDYMDYNINVGTAGSYEVDFRIACNSPVGTIQLQENGSVLGSLTPYITGGWQNWSTQSIDVNLPAGAQTLRVYSAGSGWNLNYLNFQQVTGSASDLVVGYYGSWAAYNGYTPNQIKAKDLDVLDYAFASISNNQIVMGDSGIDPSNFSDFSSLRSQNPNIKILISVGGANGSGGFSSMASTAANRNTFAQSCVSFIKTYGFDGVDIDWESPGSGDTANFTYLMQAIRSALDTQGTQDGKHYYLTFAGGSTSSFLNNIQVSAVASTVDFALDMSYDLHGPWDSYADLDAALYTPTDSSPQYKLSVDSSLSQWISAGFPANKLILGVPFYGYIYTGVSSSNNGLYSTFSTGTYIPYSQIASQYLNNSAYQHLYSSSGDVPYLYGNNTFISFDDASSVALKGQYALSKGVKGVGVWEIDNDDSNSTLLNSLYNSVH